MPPSDSATYRAAARVLALHATLSLIGRVVVAVSIMLARASPLALCTALTLWAIQEWFNGRIALDVRLFNEASHDNQLLVALDDLVAKPARPAAARVRGAFGLLKWQGLAVLAQLLTLFGSLQ